jgi:hypothetical protein
LPGTPRRSVASFDPGYYLDVLYPLQDEVLSTATGLKTGLYLSGGTAVSRGYVQHRFSEDLDLFADDAPEFALWASRLIEALRCNDRWRLTVHQREERLVRIALDFSAGSLKIEVINDVPSRVGVVRKHPVLGLLDSPDNLLANKITALLDRDEPKDLADIWGLCTRLGLGLTRAIEGAQGKAAGVFPPDLARALCSANEEDWAAILWHGGPDLGTYLRELHDLGERLLLL